MLPGSWRAEPASRASEFLVKKYTSGVSSILYVLLVQPLALKPCQLLEGVQPAVGSSLRSGHSAGQSLAAEYFVALAEAQESGPTSYIL